jgi:hypothetical protein
VCHLQGRGGVLAQPAPRLGPNVFTCTLKGAGCCGSLCQPSCVVNSCSTTHHCCQQLLSLLAPDCLDDDDLTTPKLPLPALPTAQPSRQLAVGRQLTGLLQAIAALLQYDRGLLPCVVSIDSMVASFFVVVYHGCVGLCHGLSLFILVVPSL